MEEYGSIIQGILTWSLIGIGVLMAVFGFMGGNIPMVLAGISLAGLGIAIGAAGGEDSHWAKLGQGIMDILDAVGKFFVDVWNWIKDAWNGAGEFFAGIWQSIKNAFNSVVEWFSGIFSDAWEGIKTAWNAVGEFFSGIWEAICDAFSDVGEWFSDVFTGAWEGIKTAWNAVGDWFGDVWDAICDVFSPVVDWFSDIFTDAWEGIKTAFSAVGEFFTGIWEDIKETFSTIGETVGEAMSSGIKSAINWILDKAVGLINGFIDGINWAIDVINKIPMVSISKLSRLQVPQLAKGGVVDSATLAVIGERGKEAVMPLENNTEWMDKLADRINNRNANSRIVLMVGERELGYAAINSINDITRQTGELQLTMV
jgi:phage-related protein